MPGPSRTASQIHNLHGHGRSQDSNSHEPRRQSPRNPKPSLRVREVMEALGEDGDIPLQLGKKKRSRVFEIRTMEESSEGALSREDKKRRITRRSASAMNHTKKPESKQQEASHTSWATNLTKPSISSSTSKESCKNPSEPLSTQHVQSQTLLADYAIEDVQYVSDEEEHGRVTLPQTTSQKTDNRYVIHVSSTPSSEDEEEEAEEQVVVGKDKEYGNSMCENPEVPPYEDLEFDEAEAFQPDEDIRVNGFDNSLTHLQKKGGSSRSREDIEEEQENLGVQTRDGRFRGVTLDELESGEHVGLVKHATL